MIDPRSPHTAYITRSWHGRYIACCSCGWSGNDTHTTTGAAFEDCRIHQRYWTIVEDDLGAP